MSFGTEIRPKVAFFGFADVFEDFYPHLGVDRHAFATRWAATGNHAFASVIQDHVGEVTWYELSLDRPLPPERHVAGMQVDFVRSSLLHRVLWRLYYAQSWSWRLRSAYRPFATASSYLAPLSIDLVKAIRLDRPDVLFAQDYSSGRFDVLLAAARLLRVPLITYHSGSTPEAYTGRLIRKRTLRRADAVLVTSTTEQERLTDEFGVDPGRCHILLTPIDTALFTPDLRDETQDRDRYLLFVGRLDDNVKRVSVILQAFQRASRDHAEVRLLIVGDGPDRARLQKLGQAALGNRIDFLGWVQEPQHLVRLYANADALVLASTREGFPTVVGEAFACGTPVIATEVGGIPEVVTDGETGRLIPAGDDAGLTRAITEVLEHPERFEAMRPSTRKLAERRFDRAAVGEDLASIFKKVMKGRHS